MHKYVREVICRGPLPLEPGRLSSALVSFLSKLCLRVLFSAAASVSPVPVCLLLALVRTKPPATVAYCAGPGVGVGSAGAAGAGL